MADEVNTNPTQAGNPAPTEEKTFTQEQLDAIVGKRVSKAMKGMPEEAELKEFRDWKASKQSEAEKLASLMSERDTAKTDLAAALAKVEQYEREKLLLKKGVPAEDVDYYAFKAAQLVSDSKTFEMAVDEVIKARQPQQNKVVVSMGGTLSGGTAAKTDNDMMNALIRGARK